MFPGLKPAEREAANARRHIQEGKTARLYVRGSGLTPGVKYLGSVAYGGVLGMPNPTIVRVNP